MALRGRASWLDRVVVAMNRSRWFRELGPRVVPRLDKLVHRLTGGRYTLSGGYVPVIMLTAIGHRSGQPRTVPLAAMPGGPDRFVVVASNFGRESHPAWSENLLATPEATVEFRGRTIPVTARLIEDEERAELWPRLLEHYPSYGAYEDRVESHGRDLRIFALEPGEAPRDRDASSAGPLT